MTFSVILQRISPTPIGRKPRFLSKSTSRHATNASMERVGTCSVRIFLIRFTIAFLRSMFDSGCFSFKLSWISLLSGIHITFLDIVFFLFLDNSAIVFILLLSLKDFCIVSLLYEQLCQYSPFHKSNLLFKAFKWYSDFEFLDGPSRRKFGVTMIALNATS